MGLMGWLGSFSWEAGIQQAHVQYLESKPKSPETQLDPCPDH